MYLLLGAMRLEAAALEAYLSDPVEQVVRGKRLVQGTWAGQSVVVAATGVGKVNAAFTTGLVLGHLEPQAIIVSGVAGSLHADLHPGDIVLGQDIAQYDYGRVTDTGFLLSPTPNGLTFQPNPLHFPVDDALLAQAQRVSQGLSLDPLPSEADRQPQVITGRIITGDLFVTASDRAQALRQDFQAEACDMESGAIAQVCSQLQIPCLVIRGISDQLGHIPPDIMERAHLAARNAARVVDALMHTP